MTKIQQYLRWTAAILDTDYFFADLRPDWYLLQYLSFKLRADSMFDKLSQPLISF